MKVTPRIRIEPSRVYTSLSGGMEGFSSTVHVGGKLKRFDSIRTPDGEDLSGCEWSISLHDGRDHATFASENACLGAAAYVAAFEDDFSVESWDQSFEAWIYLAPERYASLFNAISAGRTITSITFAVDGIEYDNLPDGSGKLWDIQKVTDCKVVEFGLTLDFPKGNQAEEFESDPVAPPAPVTGDQMRTFEQRILSSLSRMQGSLTWISGAAVLIALIAIFK